MTASPVFLFLAIMFCAFVGAWLGDKRNSMYEGFFLGLVFGPIGCIIAILLPDKHQTNKPR